MTYRLGIIGGGNMAEAIVRGALRGELLQAGHILVAEPEENRRAAFDSLGVEGTADNRAVVAESDNVMLAVKPQTVPAIADDLARINGRAQCTLSIMAGISIGKLTELVGGPARVIRIMPNTPLLVGLGMTGIAGGPSATDADLAFAVELFRSAGLAEVVDESMLDAVTALSGSGPAYVYYLAEAMAAAGEAMGMAAEQADRFARQTVIGAATLLHDSNDPASELRRRVTSPGGTTQAAIAYLDAEHVKAAVIDAIRHAESRSRELGR